MTIRPEDVKPGVVLRSRIALHPVDVTVMAVADGWAMVRGIGTGKNPSPTAVSIEKYLCSVVEDGGTRFEVKP